MQLDCDWAVQEHDHVRGRVAVLLGLLDGNLAERAEDVTEVGGQVVENTGLDVRAFDLGGRQMGPGLLLGEALLVERDRDEEGLRVPVVRVAAVRVVEDLPADALEERVALPGLLHGVLAVPAAADRGAHALLGDLVLEHHHGVVVHPIEEPALMPAVVETRLAVYEVGAELPAVVAPLSVPVPAEVRGAPLRLLWRLLIRRRGIRSITRQEGRRGG